MWIRFFSIKRLALFSLFISNAFYHLPIFAAGFQLNEVSTSLQGAATAGSAAAFDDVSAMFANPATLTTLLSHQAYVGGSLIAPNVSMHNASAIHTVNIPGSPPSSISAVVTGKTSQDNVTAWALDPNFYLGWRIYDNLVAGIAMTGPFGLQTLYERHSVLRFAALKSSLLTLNVNPALAYKINEKWSVGFGLQFQYAKAKFSNFNGPYTGIPEIDDFIASNFPTKLHAHGMGFGYNLGVLFQPIECVRLGVGFRSRVVQHLHGQGNQYTSPGGVVPAPTHNFLFNARTEVWGSINTPAVLSLGVTDDFNEWTLKASAQLNFWHSFNHLSINMPDAFGTNSTIPTNWKNAWFYALGADYRFTPEWTFRAGTAYDRTPTRQRFRDPRIPDADRYWLTLGFTFQPYKHLSVDGAYEHIFGKNSKVNVTQASGQSPTSTLPLEVNQVRAKYRSSVNVFAIALRYRFC